jgi:hypothetical protein
VLNDERLIFKSGCACEGKDTRSMTIYSVRNPAFSLTLNHANYFINAVQDFHLDHDFIWAVTEKEIITWDFKTLKSDTRIKHKSCHDPAFFQYVILADSADENPFVYMKDKDTAYLLCNRDAHLTLYQLGKQGLTVVFKKHINLMYRVFLLPAKVVVINKKGQFSILPFGWQFRGHHT